ncbi:MAG: hypothetical protein AAGK05_16850, partial [Pseudomonadota bacterium]
SSLKDHFKSSENPSHFFLAEESSDELVFLKLAPHLPPKIDKSVVVFSDLTFDAFEEYSTIPAQIYEPVMQFSNKITRYNDFLI